MPKFKSTDIVECTTQPPPEYRIKKGELFRVHRAGLGAGGCRIEVVRIRGSVEELVTAPHPDGGPTAIWMDERWFATA